MYQIRYNGEPIKLVLNKKAALAEINERLEKEPLKNAEGSTCTLADDGNYILGFIVGKENPLKEDGTITDPPETVVIEAFAVRWHIINKIVDGVGRAFELETW